MPVPGYSWKWREGLDSRRTEGDIWQTSHAFECRDSRQMTDANAESWHRARGGCSRIALGLSIGEDGHESSHRRSF